MSVEFSKELIKGKIAEVIFEQMIREEKLYTVIPFGYEHTVPTLAQYRGLAKIENVINNISDAPDFVLISNDKREVHLVEVKYRSMINEDELKEVAASLLKRWNPSWIFLATRSGFFCSPSNLILRNSGKISKLSASWVSLGRQTEYLKLLNEFEK